MKATALVTAVQAVDGKKARGSGSRRAGKKHQQKIEAVAAAMKEQRSRESTRLNRQKAADFSSGSGS